MDSMPIIKKRERVHHTDMTNTKYSRNIKLLILFVWFVVPFFFLSYFSSYFIVFPKKVLVKTVFWQAVFS